MFGKKWEALCLHCGACCCEKYPLGYGRGGGFGTVSVSGKYFIDFERPCPYLDIETGRCLVYEQRFSVCSACMPMTPVKAIFADYLPETCGYVLALRPWLKWRHKT